jgi:hypothetical protein
MECQEVSIATDDMCSVATHGQFKKLVVLWIAASGYLPVKVKPIASRVSVPQENFEYLSHPRIGGTSFDLALHRARQAPRRKAIFPFSESQLECVARLRFGQQ